MPRTVGCCSLVLLLAGAAAAWAGTSNAPNPVVSFSTPGTKQVELQVCNLVGCTTVTQTIEVLDPNPALTGSPSVTPNPVFDGFVVHFSASATGAPPLTFTWRILDVLGGQVATFQGATADWTANVAPGLYSVELVVSNSFDSDAALPIPLTVLLSPFLFSDGFEGGSTLRWQQMP